MGNGVGRVKEWMGLGEDRVERVPETHSVKRYVRLDEIDIRHYLVHWVKSSLYRDSEGSLGHEFYEEAVRGELPPGSNRRVMRRVTENLTSEEIEPLPYPALSSKLPIIFCRPDQ